MFVLSVVSTVLCAERVGQMTKTYSDIDAVTRLLEEVREPGLSLGAHSFTMLSVWIVKSAVQTSLCQAKLTTS